MFFPSIDLDARQGLEEAPARGKGRARDRGHFHRLEPVRGRSRGVAPARRRAREVSLKPHVEINKDQKIKPPKFQGGKSEDAHEFLALCHKMLEDVARDSAPLSKGRGRSQSGRDGRTTVGVLYLHKVKDTSVELPPMDYVSLVREFVDVLPTNLLGAPPNRDIDLKQGTKSISIHPYRMTPAESKELSDQL
ncbi:hypothetical protein MTR67_012841 [Solanum verrucosum]|uniref:Gag protease polyprotein n=1 Tax=Solanum verrucosum TaxID=315347 RepID=A0AAF0Q9Z7_SOLVR|nr:hypothetical protein MTR67_012841 [Solanum verrucosum]